MKTLQKNLAILIAEAFFTLRLCDNRCNIARRAIKKENPPLLTPGKQSTLQKRKTDAIRWFHLLINIHLVALLVLGYFIPIPASHKSLYNWVCLVAGWVFYYTMNRWIMLAINHKAKCPEKGFFYATGLHGLAGYNRQTRLVLMIFLAIAVIATFAAHTSFALMVGFSLRWLIESQVLELVAPQNDHQTKISPVKKYFSMNASLQP